MSKYPYTFVDNKLLRDGKPIATLVDRENSETGPRIASMLNIAERDEAFLDKLVTRIAQRNDA